MKRRTFISAAAVGSGALISERVLAQTQQPAWVSQMSPAVCSAVVTAAQAFQGTAAPTAWQVRVFQNALATYFAQLLEVGAIPQLESSLKSSGLLDTPLSYEQLGRMRQATGFTIPDAAFNAFATGFPGSLPMVRSMVYENGMVGAHAVIIAELGQLAQQLEGNIAIAGIPRAYFKPANHALCDALPIISGYTAVWGFQAAIGVIALGPVGGVVLAVAGVGLAVAAFFC
jgi:hypothetical protein